MIAGFLRSSSHNLKYVGIDALARVTRINAKYAAEHQLAVVDCLEDPDDTLKKKTLELLFKMTKPNNVEVRSNVWYTTCIDDSVCRRGGGDTAEDVLCEEYWLGYLSIAVYLK